jgi:hypothetical protein
MNIYIIFSLSIILELNVSSQNEIYKKTQIYYFILTFTRCINNVYYYIIKLNKKY